MNSPQEGSVNEGIAENLIKELNDCIVMVDPPSPSDWAEQIDFEHGKKLIMEVLTAKDSKIESLEAEIQRLKEAFESNEKMLELMQKCFLGGWHGCALAIKRKANP